MQYSPDGSGTTENFTDHLHAVVPEIWGEAPSGTWPTTLGNEDAKGNAGVVSTVAGTESTVTYTDDSAVGDSLGKVVLRVGEGYVPVRSTAVAAEATRSSPISPELSRQATDAISSIEVGDIP